jgi:hypothetical protein
MRLVDAGVTVKDRVLLHLLDYWGQIYRAEWPVAQTQDGIAGVLGISRSHVAVTLPDLIEEDLAEVSTQRVEGRPRRVKVYNLTYKGGTYAGSTAQQLLQMEVTAVDDTGEWELPLDGLIQVHKVHMLSALRLVDEDNRVDLRKAAELATPVEAAGEVEAPEEAADEEVEEGVDEAAPTELEEVAGPVPVSAEGPSTPVDTIPLEAPAPEGAAPSPTQPQGAYGQYPPGQVQDYGHYTHPTSYWSPLRFGSGRRPSASYVSAMLVLGFLTLMSAVALFGVSPTICAVGWVPLAIVGGLFASIGFRTTWALGPRREVWTAAALAAYMLLGVTMVLFAAFGREVVIDLLWAGLILGIPSLALAAGTGRSVERRGTFMLLIGPVMVIASLTMAVLDPEGMGRTAAMPILIVAVGVGWTLVGWMMVRGTEAAAPLDLVAAGSGIGLAIAALAGAGNLAVEGGMNPVLGTAVAFWVLGAVYMAAVMLLPSMAHLRPDMRMVYSALAVAGAAALLTASVFFVWGGLLSVGILEAVMAIGMLALVAPEMKDMGKGGLLLVIIGVLMAVTSVLAVSVGL